MILWHRENTETKEQDGLRIAAIVLLSTTSIFSNCTSAEEYWVAQLVSDLNAHGNWKPP